MRRERVCSRLAGGVVFGLLTAAAGPAAGDVCRRGDALFFLNSRLEPNQETARFIIPRGRDLIITDIVAQNRSPGDAPAPAGSFSRLAISGTTGDIFLTIVENSTLSLHFTTGFRVHPGAPAFRVLNITNSTAPFFEIVVTGCLD